MGGARSAVFSLDLGGQRAYSERNRTTLDVIGEWVPATRSFASPEPKTMTNDLVALIEFYEKEKSIEREKVVEALENAFLSAYRRMVPGAEDIEELRAEVDTKHGETRIFASLKVVADDDHVDKFNEVPITLAQKKKPDAVASVKFAHLELCFVARVFRQSATRVHP